MKEFPDFHDGRFEGLWVDAKSAYLFLATEGRERHVVAALGVAALTVNGMREGNVILDVAERRTDEITEDDIERLYGTGNTMLASQSHALLARARAEALMLLEINPSYGATCTVLAKSLELVKWEDWLNRYLLPKPQDTH